MTNEEMAVEIKAGRMGYGELWAGVQRFVRQQAVIFFYRCEGRCIHCGVELEDLMQCGFLALCDAVKAFDPARGYKLLAWMKYPLKCRFNEACNLRTTRQDPLNDCTSLDNPLDDETDDTIGDTVPDERAADEFTSTEDRLFNDQLHNALEISMHDLSERQADVIRRRYWNRDSLDAIADNLKVSRETVRQTERTALRNLRKPSCERLLRSFIDEMRSGYAWRSTGFHAWKNTRASCVERAVESTDELRRRIRAQHEQDKSAICALLRITPEEYDRRFRGYVEASPRVLDRLY